MRVGDTKRWWNRRVPILRIGAIAGFALIAFYTWVFLGDYIDNAIWSVCHQRTTSFRGQRVRIPWLWREKKWTNYNQFELTRSYVGNLFGSDVEVTYANTKPADVQKKVDGLRRLWATLSKRSINVHGVDDLKAPNFICLDEKFGGPETLTVSCFSLDGRWSVQLIGLERSRSDFATILRGRGSHGDSF